MMNHRCELVTAVKYTHTLLLPVYRSNTGNNYRQAVEEANWRAALVALGRVFTAACLYLLPCCDTPPDVTA